MGQFSEFYPTVCFSYFMAIILLTVILGNPVYILLSFLFAFLYRLKIAGKNALSSLKFIFPVILLTGVFNMFFSHFGVTRLFSVGSYDFTLESLLFGLSTGVMLGSVILWFLCYTDVVTSEKFIAVFGGFMPNLALLFSMVLRFIPLMVKTSNEIKEANIGLGNEVHGLKNSINRFSCLVSISLEKSMETADAMRSRGFGSGKRKPFNRYKFSIADGIMLVVLLVISAVVIVSYILKINAFTFEPKMFLENNNVIFYVLFAILSALPVAVDCAGEIKWHFLKSKI